MWLLHTCGVCWALLLTWPFVYVVYFMLVNLLSWDPLPLSWSMDEYYILEPHVALGGFHCTFVEVSYTLDLELGDLAHFTWALHYLRHLLHSFLWWGHCACSYAICWGHLFDILPLLLPWDHDTLIHRASIALSSSHFIGRPSLTVQMCDGVAIIAHILRIYLEGTQVDEVGYLHIYLWIDLVWGHLILFTHGTHI